MSYSDIDVQYVSDDVPSWMREWLKVKRNALLAELRAIEELLGMDRTLTAREVRKLYAPNARTLD